MLALKPIASAVIAAAAFFSASSARAAGYEIWDGFSWIGSGVIHFSGYVKFVDVPATCTVTYTVTLTSGAAQITDAIYGGSSFCSNIMRIVPTAVSSPFPSPVPSSRAAGMGLGMGFKFPLSALTCTGTVGGELSNAYPYLPNPPWGAPPYNYLNFNGLVNPCRVGTNAPGLSSDRPIRVIFP